MRRKNILNLAGLWKNDEEMLKIMKLVIKDRKSFRLVR